MTTYQRNCLTWACIIAVELTIGLAAMYLSNWFVIPFFVGIAVVPFLLNRITCPKCGTRVTYQGKFFGFRINGGFIRKKCQECGWDLNATA